MNLSDMAPFLIVDPMPPAKRARWVEVMSKDISRKAKTKFVMGQLEHGCDFGEQTVDYLLQAIEEEAIDTLMYIRELKRRRANISPEQLGLKKG